MHHLVVLFISAFVLAEAAKKVVERKEPPRDCSDAPNRDIKHTCLMVSRFWNLATPFALYDGVMVTWKTPSVTPPALPSVCCDVRHQWRESVEVSLLSDTKHGQTDEEENRQAGCQEPSEFLFHLNGDEMLATTSNSEKRPACRVSSREGEAEGQLLQRR